LINDIKDIVISSRIRLARNVTGYPLPDKIDIAGAREIDEKVALALGDGFQHISMQSIDAVIRQSLFERHLISQNLLKYSSKGSVFFNKAQHKDYLISVMVNEEDHIRAQCIHDGLSLNYAFDCLNAVDNIIIRNIDIAASPLYGFLTGCLTNAGTGLRASVMVFLPALCVIGGVAALTKRKSMRDMTIRGAYGEGSEATSYLFQISNRSTMGKTEDELISEVYGAMEDIAFLEAGARDSLLRNGEVRGTVTNSFKRLTNQCELGLNEFITHFSNFKLGVGLGYYNVNNLTRLNKMIDEMQTATLIVRFGINPDDIMIERGKRVSEEIRLLVD